MATVNLSGANLGNSLQDLLMCEELQAGEEPSYQVCRTIYLYHPLGAKMAESPVRMAQSQAREISIPGSPEDLVRDAFLKEWLRIGADAHIHNTMTISRVYGIASLALLAEDVSPDKAIVMTDLPKLRLGFNVLDPLNTAGSLVLNQNPNAIDFQKTAGITISGQPYHRSRTITIMNERPIYIAYTNSAFGFVGRSVYQRALYPLKSFVQSMITDDMVMKKGGVLVAMMKQAGSIIDNVMAKMSGVKRSLLKEARGDNVLSIGENDKIESLNFQNLEGPVSMSRKHILENIAVGADMPAKLLNSETFAEGFGEGTEDAKAVASYVDRIRLDMAPLYAFFDEIVRYRAWNPDFYKTIQAQFPEEYGQKGYTEVFYEWSNVFKAQWPSLLKEPDSEKIKVEDVKLKALIAAVEVLLDKVDPDNKGILLQWFADNVNENTMTFPNPLTLDVEAFTQWSAEQKKAMESVTEEEPGEPKPFSAAA